MSLFDRLRGAVAECETVRRHGVVTKVIGLVIEATGPQAPIGEICLVRTGKSFGSEGRRSHSDQGLLRAEVVGFRDNRTLLMPIGEMAGVAPGQEVVGTGSPLTVKVGPALLGRVIDGLGQPMDDKGPIKVEEERSILAETPDPLKRPRVHESLALGVRAIDGILTVGRGQRLGIFAGSGVGKSTVLGMISRFTEADVNVIALIGERGREVRDFIERDLGPEGLKRSVVIVATSDKAPLVRLRGAFVATVIAEYFRDVGKDVLFMMDSVTRFARSQREVGLAVGEPPATRGFTPSVFTLLPRLLERTGTSERGTITGLYTILVDADDMNEPIADNVRGILDGHIVLSRSLAARNHYPAIDILNSVSRVMVDIVPKEHQAAAGEIRRIVATYQDAEDLINIGAYVKGTNPGIDRAIDRIGPVNQFLRQGIFEKAEYDQTLKSLEGLVS